MNQMFSSSTLKTFVPIFNRHSLILTNNLKKYLDQDAFEITKFIFECNFDIICGELEFFVTLKTVI